MCSGNGIECHTKNKNKHISTISISEKYPRIEINSIELNTIVKLN